MVEALKYVRLKFDDSLYYVPFKFSEINHKQPFYNYKGKNIGL